MSGSASYAAREFSAPKAAWALLVVLALAWGTTWPMMKIAVAEIPIFSFRALCIIGVGVATLAMSKLMHGRILPNPGEWLTIFRVGLIAVTCWYIFSAVAVLYLPAGRSALLAFTSPLWALIVEAVFYRVPVTRRRLIAVGLSLAAIGVLGHEALLASDLELFGLIAILAAACAWATSSIMQQRAGFKTPLMAVMGWQMFLGGMPVILLAPVIDGFAWTETVSLNALLATASVTFWSTCFGVYSWYTILRMTTIAFASIASLVVPFTALMLSTFLLGEAFTWVEGVGLVLITCALATTINFSQRNRSDRA